jgi:hypothetical protein
VPEDPFGDLSRSRSAGGRSAERDAAEEERPDEAPPPARPGSRYTWVVGVAALIAIVFAVYNLLTNTGVGEGTRGPEPGSVLPDFAAPSARGGPAGDANIRQRAGGTEAEGPVPACEVEAKGVVNICELRDRPVVVTFVLVGCEDALDQVERVRRDFPRVTFVGVISETPEEAEPLLEPGRWRYPVVLDPDNAVFNLYRVGDCPSTVFAEAGGEVAQTTLGYLSDAELRSGIAEVAHEPSRGGS